MSDELMTVAKALLRYEEAEGRFYWLERPRWLFKSDRAFRWWNKSYAGKMAGCKSSVSGYRSISILGITHIYEHRLVWFMHHGECPEITDHIDGVRDNNRIGNLRSVNDRDNQRNKAKNRNNTSGVSGVYQNKKTGNWYAHIWENNKPKSLGTFKTFELAVDARKSAEAAHGYHSSHGRELVDYNARAL